jgi:hypothetical protein
MLPGINAQQRGELPNHGVLILSPAVLVSAHQPPPKPYRTNPKRATHSIGLDPNPARLIILHQPRPPTPLDPRQRRIELALHLLQPAKGLIDLLAQRSTRRLPASLPLGRQVLPEKRVVEVSTAVEVEEGLQGDLGGNVGFRGRGGEFLGGVVEGVHVGLVVFAMVELHDLAGDGGFEGAVVVWGQGVC